MTIICILAAIINNGIWMSTTTPWRPLGRKLANIMDVLLMFLVWAIMWRIFFG